MFGQALGRSLDVEAIRDVVVQHLPKLAGSDDAWVMVREEGIGRRSAARRATDAATRTWRAPTSRTARS